MPDITVIIPIHNRARVISRALDSVLAQTLPAQEIIVVDDGSTDGITGIMQKDYPFVSLISQANKGVSAARNTGICAATGEWIALLDSDDAWLPGKLEAQMAYLHRNPGHKLVHTNEIWIRDGVEVRQLKKHRKYGGHIFQRCLPLCVISPSSVVIHGSIFRDTGLFDETLPVCEDYDMWLRICAHYPVLYLDKKLIIKYGGHDDQLSRRYWGMDRFRILALKKILENKNLAVADKKAAIDSLRHRIGIYLSGAEKYGTTELVTDFEKLLVQYPGTEVINDAEAHCLI